MREEYTIDELAHETDLPASTIRMYQNRGLLAAPTKRGRVGIYNSSHRGRLSLIANLQERGFSLAAIKDVVQSWEKGHSLADLLAVGDVSPTLRPEPIRVPLTEVLERFPSGAVTPEDLRRSVKIGLAEIDGSDFVAADSAFLDVAVTLAQMGIPTSEILTEYEALQPRISEIVERFGEVFERNFWEGFVADGKPEAQLPKLADQVDSLTQAANQIVSAVLVREFLTLAKRYLEPPSVPDDDPNDA